MFSFSRVATNEYTHYHFNLLIILFVNVFGTDYAIKCQEKLSKNVLFCPTNSPKLKDIKFIIIYDKEKQQRLTTEKLELGNVLHFCSKKKKKNDSSISQSSKQLQISCWLIFIINQLIIQLYNAIQ